jgi:tape measure domain-containing protein
MPEDGGGGYEAGSVFIGVEADTSPFFTELDAIATRANRIPTVRVDFDHGPLTAGNRHIESKFTHVLDVNRRLAQTPITPTYDGSQANRLAADLRAVQGQVTALQQQRIQLEASLNADSVRAQLDAIANQPRTIYYAAVVQMSDIQASAQMTVKASVTGLGEAINPELKKAFKDAGKEARGGNVLGAIGSVVAAPFKLAGGVISQAVGGAVFGLGQQLTNDFSKGLTASLGGKLAGSVGSPALLGEKAGDLLANLGGAARDGIVAKAQQANSAIDKALAEGTLEFGNFTIKLDRFKPQFNNFKRIKKELDEAVVLGIQDYYDALEDVFPTADRIAEAAAQRAKVQRRRQNTRAIARPQVVEEGQAELRGLATRQATVNEFLSSSSSITKDERRALEAELNRIRQRRSEIIGTFKSISTPELQRQGAQSAINRTGKNIAAVSQQLNATRQSEVDILANPTADNILKLESVQASIATLTKRKVTLERNLERQQANFAKIPEQATAAVQEIFDAVLGATVPLEKLPTVIIDQVRATEASAKAFYSAFENVIVVNDEIAKQIRNGQLVGKELEVLIEEVSHALQFNYGSPQGLDALSTRRGTTTQPLNRVATPTPQETISLAQELQNYDPRVRIVELEAKTNAQRKRQLIEDRRNSENLAKDLEQASGFGGARLSAAAQSRVDKSRQQIAEIQSLAQQIGVDLSATIDKASLSVSQLETDIAQTLEGLATAATQQLPLAEVESIKTQYLDRLNQFTALDNAISEATEELKTKFAQQKSAAKSKAESQIVPPQSGAIATTGRQTIGGAIAAVTDGAIIPAAKQAGNAIIAVGKAGYKAAEGLEALVLDLIPAGRTLKATTQFAAKNIALPTAAAIAVSRVPGVGGLEQTAISAAGDLVSQLVGLTRSGIASQVQAIVSQAIPSFIPGSQNIVATITNQLTSLATGVLDATGTATAEGLATVLSGSAVLNVLKKSVGAGAEQASKGLSAAGSSIINNKQVQAVAETQIPFTIPEREKVLEFAKRIGVEARKAEEKTIQFAENTLKGIKLLTVNIPDGQNLADLGLKELQTIKQKLAARFDDASDAERQGRPVIGGSAVIRGDIQRVQQVIEAKSEVVPTTPKVTKAQYENDLKKIIQAESRQIEKLRSQLIESLRSGATSDALRVAEQLKSSSQLALGKLETFKGNTNLDLEPAIRKSVNGYITRFKDLIAQAESATAKVATGEDFGALLSINTEQIAERFVGLINKLFEVEGKNLQDALGKAATSPRAKDLAVTGVSIAGGAAGRQLGVVPGIGGEVAGAMVARQAVNVGKQAIAARNELLQTELYQTATALEKLQQVATLTAQKLKNPQVQSALGQALTGDIAGSSLGNLSAILGDLAFPGAGSVTGAVGGIGGAGQIQSIRNQINEQISKKSGGGVADQGILLNIDPSKASYSAAQVEILEQVEKQLAEIQRLYQQIENGAKRVAAVEADIAKTEGRNRRNLRFNTVEQDRNQRAAALEVERLKTPQNDLSQFLSRVPGTFGGGRGPRVPGPPTLFIPELEPRITAFDVAKKAASGFLGIVDKIPAPIKSLFTLLGGGFIGFQAFQILTSQARESYDAIKQLESTKISLDISTAGKGTQALDDITKRAADAGGNLAQFRENYVQFAAALRNTPLEGQTRRLSSGVDTLGVGLQLPTEQVQRVRTQVTQIASKPNVQREDLITLSESLPGAFALSARAIGVTNAELSKLLETGQLAGNDFIPKLINVINKDFSGSLINSSKSIQSAENRLASANIKFQELGQTAAPIAAAGLNTLAGILDFVTSNSNTLGTALRLSVLGGITLLAKAAIPLIGNFLELARSTLLFNTVLDKNGFVVSKTAVPLGSLVKGLALGAIQFGAIALAAQVAVNAISLFGDKSGNVGEALKASRRELAEYEKRLNAIGKKDPTRTETSKGTYKTFRELQSDTGQDIGKAQELKDRRKEQGSNFFSRANENVLDLFQKGDFFYKNSLEKTISDRLDAANKQQVTIDKKIAEAKKLIADAGGDVASVNPVAFDATADVLNKEISRLKTLQETAESIAEKNVYDKQLKQLEPLVKLFEKSALPTLNLAKAFAALDVVNVRAESRIGGAESSNAIARGEGRINDFQSQADTLKATVEEREKQLQATESAFNQLKAYRASAEYASRVGSGQLDPTAQDNTFYGKEKEFYAARTQLGEALTKSRETQYNRRAELLQREITDQDNFRAKLEAISRVRSSAGQARIAERQANRTISPVQVQLGQSAIAQQESADKVAQLNQKLIDQRKDTGKALKNLQQVNPNDEQAYQAAKAQYEGLRNAAISTQAEINDARKQGFDAVAQANQAVEEQIRTQIDLTARKTEQGITAQQQATERLRNAQKRQIEASVAGLQRQQKFLDLAASAIERAAKLSGKRSELSTAINQGAQIPLNGTIAAIRDVEGLIQKLKQTDLDPSVRGRTIGVLNQLGISNNEQDAFRYRISEEEKLARLKAEGISAEIQQSQLTLDFEQRREEFASKRAVLAAQETVEAAKRSAIETEIERKKAENEVRRSQIGIAKATAQLDLAQKSGDPNKVKEAQLNLQDAQLTAAGAQETLLGTQQTEKLAKDALPNATLSVVDALANFAATIEGGKLSRRILGVQNQNKANQFGQEERGRVRGLAIEGIDKGVSVDINNGGADGFDPLGYRAARANAVAINQRERQRLQNNVRGISGRTTLPTVTLARPVDTSAAFGSNAQAEIEKRLNQSMPPISTATLESQLSQLIALLGDANGTLVSISTKKPPVPPPAQIINQRVALSSNGGLPGR